MIKFEHADIVGWRDAIRGMRNPMNSWEKSKSAFGGNGDDIIDINGNMIGMGELCSGVDLDLNDKDLAMRLAINGPVHAKYRRMITVYVDITAPLYWWKEFDTYKVGTVSNSCSTMHKIHEKKFTLDDFSHEHLVKDEDVENFDYYFIFGESTLKETIKALNIARDGYLETKDKKYWWQMIQLLPSSYNQRRTIMMNYEVLSNIYHYRRDHKLDEWREMCDWIKTLPYSELITLEG